MAQNYYLLLRLWLTPYNHQLFSLEGSSSPKQISMSLPNLSHHVVSNSCNGLICLYTDFSCGRDIFLCNPTTKETRLLPPSCLVAKTKDTNDGMILGVGMGHDHRSKDLIKVVRLWNSYYNCSCKSYIVEEYDLRSDSWRIIESTNPWSCEFDTYSFAMHCKGVYYWWGKVKGLTTTIVTLDVGGGTFNKVALPRDVDISNSSGRYLGVLNEYITLVCRNCYDQNANFDIWAMHGGGTLDSCWTQLRTIEHSSPCTPLVFWKGNELLLKVFNKMRSYNVDTKEIYDINFENEGRGVADICEAIFCVKSRISVNSLPTVNELIGIN